MSAADAITPVSAGEAVALFAPLQDACGVVLAVSGGPDSTALLVLAARWRRSLSRGPALLAVTVDHGLRPESRAEAEAVKRLAKQCGVAHRTMRWAGPKPTPGLQQAAREARYRLLSEAAARIGANHILTAHTHDDQAETLLIRMSRGSGITGLCGMTRISPLPAGGVLDIHLIRPFLDLPKARLVATLADAGLSYADDPSNRDPKFTRPRVRALMPVLAREGLTAARLAQLARRLRRAGAAIEAAADAAWTAVARERAGDVPSVVFDFAFPALPAEVQLRLLGRAIARVGDEGPVELGKLEALQEALQGAWAVPPDAGARIRRTLAGAVVTRTGDALLVERAPPRRRPGEPRPRPRRRALNHGTTLPPQAGGTALE
ncbi:MAG: tRNA lysidine(34) synthetase TilS [Rhizobiales bacterium]|nr:tRNA lysidine(34) synthetase TilS [Hyphomicrobiales bacterium]